MCPGGIRIRPPDTNQAEDEWERINRDLSVVDALPTRRLTGCLSWVGLLFGSPESFEGLLYLDDFPMSIGFTMDRQQIEAFLSRSRVIKHTHVMRWIQQLSGWETRLMK